MKGYAKNNSANYLVGSEMLASTHNIVPHLCALFVECCYQVVLLFSCLVGFQLLFLVFFTFT